MEEAKENIPKVILLGNGINRAFGGISWDKLLNEMSEGKYKNAADLKSPMPLRAILVTGDKIDVKLDDFVKNHKEAAFGKINEDHAEMLREILSLGADHILTTNYSYELEFAAQSGLTLSESKLSNLQRHTAFVVRSEGKYLLSTFNLLEYGGISNWVWHIHGEARKPSSIVLGHYYYGDLLYRIKEFVESQGRRYIFAEKNKGELYLKSWIDAFLLGDVYILGSRLDLSEIDLWWLINRKKRENAHHGEIYFYEPKEERESTEIDERLGLIELFATVKDMDITIPSKNKSSEEERSELYREFYREAIKDISDKMKK